MLSNVSDILGEVERLQESRWLKESAQLRSLLRYVVQETLAGRQDGLKEYSLGKEVFHRHPDYDPRNDAIVRVQASLLRKRLASYYENEGRESTLRIELPRGGYLPVFREAEREREPVASEPPEPARDASVKFRWRAFASGLAIGAVVVAAGFLTLGPRQNRRPPAPPPAVWGAFIQPGAESIVSFGVPLFYTGGGIFLRDTRINVPGDESKRRWDSLERVLGERLRPQEDVYTGIGDLVGTHEIIRWLESYGVRTRQANSNYLGQSDVAGKNLVVVSSVRFQTLLKEMNLANHFRFDESTGGGFFIDNPIAGELRHYQATTGTGVETSYAVLSLWPGKRSEHRILYLTGITTWATQGAAQYVVSPERIGDLQTRLDADPPEGPRGRKSPFFQVLLRVEGKYNQVRTASYVTHRYLPPPK